MVVGIAVAYVQDNHRMLSSLAGDVDASSSHDQHYPCAQEDAVSVGARFCTQIPVGCDWGTHSVQ